MSGRASFPERIIPCFLSNACDPIRVPDEATPSRSSLEYDPRRSSLKALLSTSALTNLCFNVL